MGDKGGVCGYPAGEIYTPLYTFFTVFLSKINLASGSVTGVCMPVTPPIVGEGGECGGSIWVLGVG